MSKFRLLLVDAVIVIHLHELGLWNQVVSQCDVHLSRGIVGEVKFYHDPSGQKHSIDLTHAEQNGLITVHEVPLSAIDPLKAQFGPVILEKLDAGEAELLALLYNSFEDYQICSADAIVYRVLGALSRSDQGISLAEVLQGIGITRSLARPYSQRFREQFSRQGFQEGITGLASTS